MNSLTGKRVVVVGASSGIGREVSAASAREDAEVIMLSRSQAKLEEAARSIGGSGEAGAKLRPIAMDMLDRAAVDRTIGALAVIDHLVLVAVADELASRAPITALDTEQVERTFDKLRGYVNVARAAARLMRERGSIVMFSGASALKPPREGFSVLAAASSSILGFGRALALELAPVRVNVIMPGVVDTPIQPNNARRCAPGPSPKICRRVASDSRGTSPTRSSSC